MVRSKCNKKEFRVATTIVRCENYKPKGKFKRVRKKEKCPPCKKLHLDEEKEPETHKPVPHPYSGKYNDKENYFGNMGEGVQRNMNYIIHKLGKSEFIKKKRAEATKFLRKARKNKKAVSNFYSKMKNTEVSTYQGKPVTLLDSSKFRRFARSD